MPQFETKIYQYALIDIIVKTLKFLDKYKI